MGNYDLGDIYYIDKAYDDNPSQSKKRPAIIVDIDVENGTIYTLVATTSKKNDPPKYFDQFKYPIINWRKAGFTDPSWGLCLAPLELPKEALLDYVGSMDDGDYNRLIDFLESL